MNSSDTLVTIRETLLGEMRHRVVRRKRDGTYWYVAEERGPHGWLPRQVLNQNGLEDSAIARYYQSLA
jgi:hypothetical protein